MRRKLAVLVLTAPALTTLACTVAVLLGCTAAPGAEPGATTDALRQPLAAVLASAEVGREIFADRASGNCVLCHRIAGHPAPFQGDVGPDLSAVGQRLSPAQIRFRIVDASQLNPATVMPPYFRTEGLRQVAAEYRDRSVLTGEQIEHLIAYLATRKASTP